jgi:hypothetical protein
MASSTGVSTTTSTSLILSDNSYFGDTVYTKYHSNKYKRYRESEVLDLQVSMNDYDWSILTINQPVMYNKQIYSILSIENYDVVKNTANLKLIKMI